MPKFSQPKILRFFMILPALFWLAGCGGGSGGGGATTHPVPFDPTTNPVGIWDIQVEFPGGNSVSTTEGLIVDPQGQVSLKVNSPSPTAPFYLKGSIAVANGNATGTGDVGKSCGAKLPDGQSTASATIGPITTVTPNVKPYDTAYFRVQGGGLDLVVRGRYSSASRQVYTLQQIAKSYLAVACGNGTLILNPGGQVSGTLDGRSVQGQITVPDPNQNAYKVNITLSGGSLPTETYEGMAFVTAINPNLKFHLFGPSNKPLFVDLFPTQ